MHITLTAQDVLMATGGRRDRRLHWITFLGDRPHCEACGRVLDVLDETECPGWETTP